MRGEDGACRDWCGEAMAQLGVNASDYNHVICAPLYSSSAICDTCKGDGCANTCPAETGIATGCGCGTCYYAWGAQTSCNRRGGGPLIRVTPGTRVFLAHELGHNMGLTHAGSINCKRSGEGPVPERDPKRCLPDWYGDRTSFMGGGAILQLPAAMRYKVRWLPRMTLTTHTRGSGERRYLIRAATSRRPSWQSSSFVRWFGEEDTLAVRVELPADDVARVSSFKCPCATEACPDCTKERCAADGLPCCTADKTCADGGLDYYYVELHQPYSDDMDAGNAGIAVRMMGDLSSCTSTRQVPTHMDGPNTRYLLNMPDPTGAQLGSTFVDELRGVRIVLEAWSRSQAVVRVTA